MNIPHACVSNILKFCTLQDLLSARLGSRLFFLISNEVLDQRENASKKLMISIRCNSCKSYFRTLRPDEQMPRGYDYSPHLHSLGIINSSSGNPNLFCWIREEERTEKAFEKYLSEIKNGRVICPGRITWLIETRYNPKRCCHGCAGCMYTSYAEHVCAWKLCAFCGEK